MKKRTGSQNNISQKSKHLQDKGGTHAMKLEPEIINPEVKDKALKPLPEVQMKRLQQTFNKVYLEQRSSSSVGSEGGAE